MGRRAADLVRAFRHSPVRTDVRRLLWLVAAGLLSVAAGFAVGMARPHAVAKA